MAVWKVLFGADDDEEELADEREAEKDEDGKDE
jgi:hypothetical protein